MVRVTFVKNGVIEHFRFDTRAEAEKFISKVEDMRDIFGRLGPMTNGHQTIRTEDEAYGVLGWLKVWEVMVAEYGDNRIPTDITSMKGVAETWMVGWRDLITPILKRMDRERRAAQEASQGQNGADGVNDGGEERTD